MGLNNEKGSKYHKKVLERWKNDPWNIRLDRWYQKQIWIIDRIGFIEWIKIKMK